jgi:hypothetical protein
MYFDALQQHPETATSAVEVHINGYEKDSGTFGQEHDSFGFSQVIEICGFV